MHTCIFHYCVHVPCMYNHYTIPSDPRQQQFELKAQLREGLRSLPVPRNDFEIVVPEKEDDVKMDVGEGREGYVEDAGDVDERTAQLRREEGTPYHTLCT